MTTLDQKVEAFLNKSDKDALNENANRDTSHVSTYCSTLSGILSKHYGQRLYPEEVMEAHNKGFIHVHDLDFSLTPMTNCCVYNYPDMLENGFQIGEAAVESPKSISVAVTLLTQVIQSLGGAQYGGSTAAHIDRYLAPYVEKSYQKLKEKQMKYGLTSEYVEDEIRREVANAMQTLIYQVNTMMATTGQYAFNTITFGLDTTKWGRMITEEYLKAHVKGIGKDGKTPVFPKVVFVLDEEINLYEGTPNYDLKKLAIECSVRRTYPDYMSAKKVKEVTGITSDVVSPMGCRSFVGHWLNEKGEEQILGRMNLGVVSLNLPLLAWQAKGDATEFYNLLTEYAELCFDAHEARVGRLKKVKAKENPIMFQHGAIARLAPEETIEQLFYDGRSTASLGYVGLWEAMEILFGKEDKEQALQTLRFLKTLCNRERERTRIAFSPYGSPAESLCLKFANALKAHGCTHLGDKKYVTNSFHVPVDKQCDSILKWEYEQGFAEVSSGGFISYIEQPNLRHNTKAYESFLDFAYHRLPYFAINTPIDKCYKCGFEGEFDANTEGYKCPCCGNQDGATISVIRRISGYLGSPAYRPLNSGKQDEVMNRVKHKGA